MAARTEFSFVSGQDTLAVMTGRIGDWLRAQVAQDNTVGELLVALAEALNNILLHAYGGAAGRPLTVTCAVAADDVTIELLDEGPPFDPLQHRPQEMTGLQEHGMGVYLYTTLMHRVTYERTVEGRNRLILCRRLTPPA